MERQRGVEVNATRTHVKVGLITANPIELGLILPVMPTDNDLGPS